LGSEDERGISRYFPLFLGLLGMNRVLTAAEVKQLKALVRNIVDPSRSLGHTDRALRAANVPTQTQTGAGGKRGSLSGVSQDMESGNANANVHGKEKERCEECQ